MVILVSQLIILLGQIGSVQRAPKKQSSARLSKDQRPVFFCLWLQGRWAWVCHRTVSTRPERAADSDSAVSPHFLGHDLSIFNHQGHGWIIIFSNFPIRILWVMEFYWINQQHQIWNCSIMGIHGHWKSLATIIFLIKRHETAIFWGMHRFHAHPCSYTHDAHWIWQSHQGILCMFLTLEFCSYRHRAQTCLAFRVWVCLSRLARWSFTRNHYFWFLDRFLGKLNWLLDCSEWGWILCANEPPLMFLLFHFWVGAAFLLLRQTGSHLAVAPADSRYILNKLFRFSYSTIHKTLYTFQSCWVPNSDISHPNVLFAKKTIYSKLNQ